MIKVKKLGKVGEYKASKENIEAQITIYSRNQMVDIVRGNGNIYCYSEAIFKVNETDLEQEGFESRVSLFYSGSFTNAFRWLKSKESHIEELLVRSVGQNWEYERKVLQCIFDLEKQVLESQK